MPTKPIHLILLLAILLAGCAPAAAAETPTSLPSRTPAPPSPTPSKTSFWRIITSSPSNLSPTITMPPPHIQDNSCPATDEAYQYPFPERVGDTEVLGDHVLAALNNGMTITNLQNSLSQAEKEYNESQSFHLDTWKGKPVPHWTIFSRDLTGDGTKEILFLNYRKNFSYLPWTVRIYSCQQGKYVMSLYHTIVDWDSYDLRDLNNNGIPEFIVHNSRETISGPYLVYILEWDGGEFAHLIKQHEHSWDSDYPGALVLHRYTYFHDYQKRDDGTYEMRLYGWPWYFGSYTIPLRYQRAFFYHLYWNGTQYELGDYTPEAPEYRFEAAEDGDWETSRGNFEEALAFYDQALHDPDLKSWANFDCQEEWDYVRHSLEESQPTPIPCPTDPNEQAVLTAYIHYRKMLIYAAQGKDPMARNEYDALAQLTSSHPAYPLKGLAAAFWNEYHTSKDLAIACDNAMEYREYHFDDFFNTIGKSWHLWQYGFMRELVCPFEEEVIEPTATPAPTRTATPERIPAE